MARTMLLAAGRVLTGEDVLVPGWVEVRGDRVAEVGSGEPPGPVDAAFPDAAVVPGFVDIHVHGGGGASFATVDADEASRAVAAHRRHGTTSMMASLVSAPLGTLKRQAAVLDELVQHGDLAGVHLEGPWLSPHHAGAHDPSALTVPAADDVDAVLRWGTVRMVTLAPELDGGLEVTRRLAAEGVVVALGHTDADHGTAVAAVDAGATVATHLFNAMRGLDHRRPGPVPALLDDPRVTVELVADGVHLHAATLRFAARAAAGGFSLVTDAMAAACAPDGRYRLGTLDVDVADGEARLAGDGRIAGSTLTMAGAVRHAVTDAAIPLADAVRAATLAPAKALGLTGVGAIAAGYRADLAVLDPDLRVTRVMYRGRWLG